MRALLWRRASLLLALLILLSLVIVPAAVASPAPSPSAWGQVCTIVIQRGDNLTHIAARYGTTVGALMRWNGIRNPDSIYWGQALRVCPPYTPPPPPKPKPAPRPQPCQTSCGCVQCAPEPCQTACPCPNPCQPPPCVAPAVGPWNGEYFNNRDLSGGAAFTRQDSAINFNWGWGSPSGPQICQDNFSVRWTGRFNFVCSANYRITATVDDGIRVWVDGNLVMDEWREQSVRTFSRDVWLDGGGHDVKVEYYEQAGRAEVHLGWQRLP